MSTAQLDIFKTLGDNTRYAIFLELARASRPLTTAEIAETLSLHANTVRPHLERMRDVGLVTVGIDARGEVGRPQHRYSLSPDAPSLGLEPPVMPMLAEMVLMLADRLEASAADAEHVGHQEGRRRATAYEQAPSSLEAIVADLDRLGFDPVVSDAGSAMASQSASDTGAAAGAAVAADAAVIAFANCPFADVAERHPELVCGLHHGLVAGFAAQMGDAEVAEFCSLVHRTPCQVTVKSR